MLRNAVVYMFKETWIIVIRTINIDYFVSFVLTLNYNGYKVATIVMLLRYEIKLKCWFKQDTNTATMPVKCGKVSHTSP